MAFLKKSRGWIASRRMLFALALLCVGAQGSRAQPSPRSEYDLKALFVVTLARYTQWPSNIFTRADEPLTIGVLGANPFGRKLDSLVSNEKVQGHPLRVKRFNTPEEVQNCHLLFISETSPAEMALFVSRLAGRPLLTVSDQRGFVEDGGMVELFLNDEGRIRLRLNKDAIARAGLTLSPTLLRMVEKVAFFQSFPVTLTATNSIHRRDRTAPKRLLAVLGRDHPVAARP